MDKHYKCIEFFGLPGSGKSVLAVEVVPELKKESMPCVNVLPKIMERHKVSRVLYRVFNIMKGVFSSPGLFLKKIYLIACTKQKSLKDLVHLIINYLFILYLLAESKAKNRCIILDQGIFQIVWSVCLNAVKPPDIYKCFEGITMPDLVIIVNADERLIKSRLSERTVRQSRLENGRYLNDDEVIKKAAAIFYEIVSYLKTTEIEFISIENNTLEQLETNVSIIKNTITKCI